MPTLSFITANYVARALKYNGNTNWSTHEKATMNEAAPDVFRAMAVDIMEAGFDAMDLWTAHCHFEHHADTEYVRQVPWIANQKGLKLTSYAGGLTISNPQQIEPPLKFMKQLGIPIFAGGIWGMSALDLMPAIDAACERFGVKFALENHPETSVDELLAKIGGGKQFKHIGIALDTGWCGTHGISALDAVKRLGDNLMIIHLKDIKKAGEHDTCTLGDGIVKIEKVVKHLATTKYNGTICIEHEPYDRDPMPEVVHSLERVKKWLGM